MATDHQLQVQTQQQPTPDVPAIKPLSPSERFTAEVQKQFASNNGELELTNFQRKLIQNYFIKIDMTLKTAEQKRMAKSEQYREKIPYTWEFVNIPKLAVDVIAFSSVGFDPAQPNHINPIPFKNSGLNKYDISFIPGYRGIELKAKKYGLDLPDAVVVELVYANDTFKQIKKDMNNKIESYIFQVGDDFDRGEIKGGFYYFEYKNAPEKNKIRVFTMADIEKRIPEKASVEFWGGEKDVWKNNQVVGKEKVEGWKDEMCYKTIYRAAYNAITIDSEKIDQNYLAVVQREQENRDMAVRNEIEQNSNGAKSNGPVGFDDVPEGNNEVIDTMLEQSSNDNDDSSQDGQATLFNPPSPVQKTEAPKQPAAKTSRAPW
jgi:recombination protein RecT